MNILYMLRTFARNNTTMMAIIIFMLTFGFIQMFQPACFYNRDGSIREFGVGYKNKTILPIWLFSIILGILSYLFVLYYLVNPKFT